MGVEGAIGSKAAFADDAEEEVDALAGVALAVDALLLLLELFEPLDLDDADLDEADLDEADLDEADFFEEDLAEVFFEVAAAAADGNAIVPASVDMSATTRSAVRTRMGRQRVNRTLWRAVNASIAANRLTNFVNPTCAHG